MLLSARIIRQPNGGYTVFVCFGPPDPHNARLWFPDLPAALGWLSVNPAKWWRRRMTHMAVWYEPTADGWQRREHRFSTWETLVFEFSLWRANRRALSEGGQCGAGLAQMVERPQLPHAGVAGSSPAPGPVPANGPIPPSLSAAESKR